MQADNKKVSRNAFVSSLWSRGIDLRPFTTELITRGFPNIPGDIHLTSQMVMNEAPAWQITEAIWISRHYSHISERIN